MPILAESANLTLSKEILTLLLAIAAVAKFIIFDLIKPKIEDKSDRTSEILKKAQESSKIGVADAKTLVARFKRMRAWNWILSGGLFVLLVLFGVDYYNRNPAPRAPLAMESPHADIINIRDDAWLTSNPLLLTAMHDLAEDATAAIKANTFTDFRLVKLAYPAFGTLTDGKPTVPLTCLLTVRPNEYSLTAYALRVTYVGAVQYYHSLPIVAGDGSVSIQVPGSSPVESLLVLGCLKKKTPGLLSDNLDGIIITKVYAP